MVLVLEISKGKKANTISTSGHAAILEYAKANSDCILMEFIKFDESSKRRKEEYKGKDKLTKDAIGSIGTEIVDQPKWKLVESIITKLSLSYRHPSYVDKDDSSSDV